MNKQCLQTLWHALGVSPQQRKPWRNHYVASPTDRECVQLVASGMMQQASVSQALTGGDACFIVTSAGRAAAMQALPPDTRTKGNRRYQEYLRISDVMPDLSFGEYLKKRMYR